MVAPARTAPSMDVAQEAAEPARIQEPAPFSTNAPIPPATTPDAIGGEATNPPEATGVSNGPVASDPNALRAADEETDANAVEEIGGSGAEASSVPQRSETEGAGGGEAGGNGSMAGDTGEQALVPDELSPWQMFLEADIVVKGVMISLVLASLLSWTIWITKLMALLAAKGRVGRDHESLAQARDLQDGLQRLKRSRSPVAVMVRAAAAEIEASDAGRLGAAGIKERVASQLARIEHAAGRRISVGTSILASVGSVSPFVGLFGTVWGIMNSFIGIAKSHTTNLAVVAPGIAEALLATAIGLVAAIPAVLFYNQLAKSIGGYKAQVGDASVLVQRFVSRDLDRLGARPHQVRAIAAE